MIYEIIIFAALAVVVCVMLYSVLGKDIGNNDNNNIINFEKPRDDKTQKSEANMAFEGKNNPYSEIQKLDPDFTEAHFLNGAKAAYSMILEAFASGDRELLQSLLTPEVYKIYDEAISQRESENYRQVTDLGRLTAATVETVQLDGAIARIHILYKSELTSALLDQAGEVIEGDPDIMSSISEIWEYERNLKSSDINWRLADVVPSTGDKLEADPSPDTKAPTN